MIIDKKIFADDHKEEEILTDKNKCEQMKRDFAK